MLGPPVPQDTGKKCLVSGGWRGGAERGRAWPLRCPSSTTPRSSHHTPTTTLNTPPQVLDLDETLVHSSFRPVPHADFVIPVEIDGRLVDVYVLKRPHVDEFLRQAREREGRVE